MKELSAAIIIPVKRFNNKLKKSIEKCLELDYKNFDIFVFPDESDKEFEQFKDKIKVIPTEVVGPAIKRDLALKHSKAEIFAFLDDDACPEKDWLKNAVNHFKNKEIAAVGGPSVTPENSLLMEEASGAVFSSVLASGKYIYRYVPTIIQEVDDYPSCNFIMRRDVFEKLGGFDNSFWPGEDTKLCLDITKKLGLKIIYDPVVLVQHHRRPLFLPHLNQVANYALHRGYFAKKFPQTSLRLPYFIPSFFVLFLVLGGVISFFNQTLALVYLNIVVFYYMLVFFNTLFSELQMKKRNTILKKIRFVLIVTTGIILTHIFYGIFFIKGLMSGKLKEEKI